MNDFLKIVISGNAQKNVDYAREHMSNWVNMAIGDKAHDLADRMRGEVYPFYLTQRTGRTRDSIGAFMRKRGRKAYISTWYVRAGIGVPGSLNYLGRWVNTEHDFWHGTFNGWRKMTDIERYIGEKVEEHWNGLK